MPTTIPQACLTTVCACPYPKPQLTADRFLMISPNQLDPNHCPDNTFTDFSGTDVPKALEQHAEVVELLRSLGKEVQVFQGKYPDDAFCNNVFATNHKKQLLVGNMFHSARQKEGDRWDIRKWFHDQDYEIVELVHHTSDAAEMTGMLIMGHAMKMGFCGLSGRCTEASAQIFRDLFGMKNIMTFPMTIYHTNMGLSILAGRVCMIWPGMFQNTEDAETIMALYENKIVLTDEQVNEFAGNVLAVSENDMVVSSRGYRALTAEQKYQLQEYGFNIHHVELSELEKNGGSMRCLLAEIF
jgi:hypothetical protein